MREAGQIVNATIDKTFLGIEDHGIFTFTIYVDYGDSSHQGFGTYGLDGDEKKPSWCGEMLRKILEVAGAESWEELVGKNVRVKFGEESAGWGNRIAAIGHITKEVWLNPKELGKKYWPEEEKNE